MKLAKVKFGQVLKTAWPKSVNFWMRRVPTWEMDLGLLMIILLRCLDFTVVPFVPSHLVKRREGLREGSLCLDAERERGHSLQSAGRRSADHTFPSATFPARKTQLLPQIQGAPTSPSAPGGPGAGAAPSGDWQPRWPIGGRAGSSYLHALPR